MTDKTPATPELPEPELGYIGTDKSRQPAFSARQMREALQSSEPATQGDTPAAAAASDDEIRTAFLANGFTIKEGHTDLKPYVYAAARAILALRPQAVPMTELHPLMIFARECEIGVFMGHEVPLAARKAINAAKALGITHRADGGEVE